jgi:hypothetical protein
MSAEQNFDYPEVETYNKDGRRPLHELYNEVYARLLKRGWRAELITTQEGKLENGLAVSLPIYAFLSPKQTQEPEHALWIVGGVHGEESAPPNAFGQEIETIAALTDMGIPVVAIFSANPLGYVKDWRYPNAKRDMSIGKSVGDADYLLQRKYLKFLPRAFKSSSETAERLTKWVLKIARSYQPFLLMDHHEDEAEEIPSYSDSGASYSYAYGNKRTLNIICPWLTNILLKNGFKIHKDGLTRFKEPIKDGFVRNSRDGSTDELLASPKYIENFRIKSKKPAEAAFVIETVIPYEFSERPKTMDRRISIHSEIIRSYPDLWKIVKKN